MKYTYSFNLKNRKATKETLIYLRANIKADGKYLKYSTGEKINPTNWDFRNQFPTRLKGRSTLAIQINSTINQLSRYTEQFQLICSKLEAMDFELSLDNIKQELDYHFKKSSVSPNSLFAVFDEFIKEKKDLGTISEGTIKRYKNIKALLETFENDENYKLSFKSMNEDFYIKFVKYSRETLKHKNNTLGRNIGFIKTFLNWALLKKYHLNIDFKNFKKTTSETDEIALSSSELEILYAHDFTEHQRLEKVRDVFILGCTTGLRYSDYSTLGKEHIVNGAIHINTQKSKSKVIVPLNKYSLSVLEKYDYNLPKISPQKFREYIKEVCEKVGFTDETVKTSFIGNKRIEEKIKKFNRISTHSARRTFITLSLEKGMRQETVMSITGHKSMSSFTKYIKLSQKVREEEMLKAWN